MKTTDEMIFVGNRIQDINSIINEAKIHIERIKKECTGKFINVGNEKGEVISGILQNIDLAFEGRVKVRYECSNKLGREVSLIGEDVVLCADEQK